MFRRSPNLRQRKKYSFLKREEGVSLIEFAILGPTFIFLIMGIINIGLMMVIQNALEAAVREASRYGVTGASQKDMTRADSILQVITNVCAQYSGGIIVPSKLDISVSAYPALVNLSTGKGEIGSFGLPGQAVLYKINYRWDTFFNLFWASNIVVLHAQTPVVNEHFSTSS